MSRLLLLAFFACGEALSAAEVRETWQRSYIDFLGGRLDESLAGYNALAALGVSEPNPDANLAVIFRDQGNHKASLPYWVKSTLVDNSDGFIWSQRGWSYLALDRTKEAREAFLKAVERSTSSAVQAEAHLGLGMTGLKDSRPKTSMAPLRDALVESPYTMPAAAYQTALTALAMGESQPALTYFRQSYNLDDNNLEVLRRLARLYQRVGDVKSAWRAAHRLLSYDPADQEAIKLLSQSAKVLPSGGDPLNVIRRLTRNFLDASGKGSLDIPKTPTTMRVSLFTGVDGKPATVLRAYFMVNAPFITEANGETVKEDGKALEQWEILFRPETNIVEMRDTAQNLQFTSKQPFRLVPGSRRGSVLIKSAEFVESSGFDQGDRELRGILEVRPTPYGFKLVNELPLEDYLYGAVSALLPQESPSEAYNAMAVYARSVALWFKERGVENMEKTDICDSATCLTYLGLNTEMLAATRAVMATEGITMRFDGRHLRLAHHENCGGVTESATGLLEETLDHMVSVPDGPRDISRASSAVELERWTHGFPPRDRYCEAGALSPAAQARWMRFLDAKVLRERAERTKNIGPITHIRALRRSPTGRVLSLEVVGSKDTLSLEGEKAISDFLSPGSLRSTLFTISPLMKGSKAGEFILWGAGTGHGVGLCLAGSIGQASIGRDWRQILRHYFPKATLAGDKAPAAKPKTLRKRGLNPRRREKN